jgi:hypothetical protein
MNARYGMTVLIVSHDPNLAAHTDRVVAIRDGKTSTETVRRSGRAIEELPPPPEKEAQAQLLPQPEEAEPAVQARPAEFEELVVLDRAGRLQIPREYLETLDIGGRVRLELKEGQILIHPVSGHGRPTGGEAAFPESEALYIEEDAAPEAGVPSRWAAQTWAAHTWGPHVWARLRRFARLPGRRKGQGAGHD